MAKAAALVAGVTQPDLETIPNGTAAAVSDTETVQGVYRATDGAEPKNVLDWEVVSMDGKSHGSIKIISL